MSKTKTGDLNRRDFFKTATIAAGAILSTQGLSATPMKESSPSSGSVSGEKGMHGSKKTGENVRGRMFFGRDADFAILSAATERIFPKDETGPGAIDLKVPYFIDNQLAGAWGYNDREYVQGPFEKGLPTQGYQTPMLRREIFQLGVRALDKEAFKRFKKGFADIPPSSQDAVLKDFESNKVKMEGVEASYFFSLLQGATIAGVYADPIYAGNAGMNGWKMKEYPGAQMSYLAYIQSDKFEKIPPMSLADMEDGD